MSKVLLPGELLIDQYESDSKIIKKAGGAPANVAAAISKIHKEAYLISSVGADRNGRFLREILEENNLSTKGLNFVKKLTTVARVKIDASGERSFTFNRGADKFLNFSTIDKSLFNDFKYLHLGSATAMLGGELWKTYKKLFNISKNKIIFFDPNFRNNLFKNNEKLFIKRAKKIISRSSITKVSIEEMELLTNKINISDGAEILRKIGAKIVLVTLGEKGTLVYSKTVNTIVPSIKVNQVDTTGAGDSFFGYLIGQIAHKGLSISDLNDKELIEFVRKSNICASITVTKKGALNSIPSMSTVNKMAKDNPWNWI